jgi:hypothetical protein
LRPLLDRCRSFTVWGIAYRYPAIEDIPESPPTIAELEMALQNLEELRATAQTFAG